MSEPAFRPLPQPFAACSSRMRSPRRGSAILELVLALPVLLIIVLATVEFSLYFVNAQQLALACRVGALEAAQTPSLGSLSAIPSDVITAIEHQLGSSGIDACRVRLEHNVGGTTELFHPPAAGCDCGPATTLASPPPGEYVRLTVCAPQSELMPNCLKLFGLDVSDPTRVVERTQVFPYEG